MLERKDIKIGDLLVAISDGSLRKHPIKNNLYLVVNLFGYGHNGIFLIEIATGYRFHSETRWFKKTDNFCP